MLADALGLGGKERAEFEAAARSTHRFGRKTGRQTVRAALSRSYDLLAPHERLFYRRLGTFPESFTIREACGACTDPDLSEARALSALSSLVENSMVFADDVAGRIRYRLPAAARLFALQKAIECGEIAGNVRALLSWALGEGASPLLAAKIIRQLSLGWIAPAERMQFLNWLGAALAGIDLDELSSADFEACWLLLAEGLEHAGEPLRASAARNCAMALRAPD